MSENTRELIIETAKSLMLVHGYNHTGISLILNQAHVPKGSFYYYFESKEALGYAIIDKSAQEYFANLKEFFKDTSGSPLKSMEQFFRTTIERYDVEIFNYSCILGNLGQELAEQHEGFRRRLEVVFGQTEQFFADLFEEAKAQKELGAHVDTLKLAEFLFSYWEGSILSAKVKKSKEPLLHFLEFYFSLIQSMQ